MRGTQTDITTNLITILRKTSNIDQLIVQATTTDLDNGSIIKTDSMFASCQNSIACDSPTVPGVGPTIPVVGPNPIPNSSICPEMPVPFKFNSGQGVDGSWEFRWLVRTNSIIDNNFNFEMQFRRELRIVDQVPPILQSFELQQSGFLDIQRVTNDYLFAVYYKDASFISLFSPLALLQVRTISGAGCNPVKRSAWVSIDIDFQHRRYGA